MTITIFYLVIVSTGITQSSIFFLFVHEVARGGGGGGGGAGANAPLAAPM